MWGVWRSATIVGNEGSGVGDVVLLWESAVWRIWKKACAK